MILVNKSNDDIINEFIKNNSFLKSKMNSISGEDLKNSIKTTDRKKVISKLRSIGLGNVADKLATVSDEELLRIISRNPDLINKINSFLK